MKKLLFAIGFITAMTLVPSCSDDSLDDVKKENAVNKNEISPSVTSAKVYKDTVSKSNNSVQEAEDAPPPIDGNNPVRP